MKQRAAFLACAALLAAALPAQALGSRIAQMSTGVVLILPVREGEGGLTPIGTSGSGTLVSRLPGLILTNHHVIFDDDAGKEVEKHVIFVSRSIDEAPAPAFLASLAAYDKGLDIAVLRIEQDLAEPPIPLFSLFCFDYKNPATWKAVQDVMALDEVFVLGYPSTGDGTITITRGQVSGFTSPDPGIDFKRQFIKSDVNLSYGNSGGTAVDKEGRFVGIPTRIRNEGGGIMGLIRASDLALPVIQGALNGTRVVRTGKSYYSLSGTVLNSLTKAPVEGALFFVLNAGANPVLFALTMDDSLVKGGWQTGSNGYFRIEKLEYGVAYPLLCFAPGYQIFMDPAGLIQEEGGNPDLQATLELIPE
jgi:S1-C subfamily serine protease